MTEITAILTINDDLNYGNRLQNYALSCILEAYRPTTTFQTVVNVNSNFKAMLKNLLPGVVVSTLGNQSFLAMSLQNKILESKRAMSGANFTKVFVPDNLFRITARDGLTSLQKDKIKSVVIGSDQVWNYQWVSKEDLALRLGSFVPDDVPIISYAASFGIAEVSDEVIPIFQKYLPRLKAISVRESQGAELVKEMTGLDAMVVLDPTLMLGMNQWNKITRGFVSDKAEYVLTYFLGKPSDAQEKTIQDFARKRGCRIRRILDLRDKETYVAGPQDFVELFSKAQYVFTDSYHACCFSILYHRQFTVFNRAGMEGKANMNSRMETLFRLFDLDSVVMDEGLAPRIDYEKVDQLLAQHRTESRAWLNKAMTEE